MSDVPDNWGSLHENPYKGDRPKAPVYTGIVVIDGQKYEVVAWRSKNTNKFGKYFLTLKYTPVTSTHPRIDPYQHE